MSFAPEKKIKINPEVRFDRDMVDELSVVGKDQPVIFTNESGEQAEWVCIPIPKLKGSTPTTVERALAVCVENIHAFCEGRRR